MSDPIDPAQAISAYESAGHSSTSLVCVDVDEGVATVTLQHAPVNALDGPTIAALMAALHRVSTDPAVSVVILTGHGRGFSAGADLKEFAGLRRSRAESAERASVATSLFEAVYDVQVPMIAAMHGFAIGAGLVMSALCDTRVATDDCVMSMPEIKVGISAAGGGAQLRRLGIGEGLLRRMLIFGEQITAQEALKAGLVDQLVTSAELIGTVREMARSLAGLGRPSLVNLKQAINITESVTDWRTGYALARPFTLNLRTMD